MLLLSGMMENELKLTKTRCVEEVLKVKMRLDSSEFETQAAKQALMLK